MNIAVGLGVLLSGFVGFVFTRQSKFHYERSDVIKAPADKIYPYLSDFELGSQWSPYEQLDPSMKKTLSGPRGQVGSVLEFSGNSKSGSGRIEILRTLPNELVEMRLTMLKPIRAENIVQYKLTSENGGTRFTWAMFGDGGFVGKLMNTFIDCEKMVTPQFVVGINNLKNLIESKQP